MVTSMPDERGIRLNEKHMAPLRELVAEIRRAKPESDVPDFDPDSGGVGARVLLLMEAPGPGAAKSRGGSGFISIDNQDPTARFLRQASQAVGLHRSRVLIWNAVPWYVGNQRSIAAVRQAQLEEGGGQWLPRLVDLLPDLRAAVLLGNRAQLAWLHAYAKQPRSIPIILAPHPSLRSRNLNKRQAGEIEESLHSAREHAERE